MKRTPVLFFLIATLFGPVASAQTCVSCDQELDVTLDHLECMAGRIDGLIEEALKTDPVLIDLTDCSNAPFPADRDEQPPRGEIPSIDAPSSDGPEIGDACANGASCPQGKAASSQTAVFFILSHAQLTCLRAHIDSLIQKAEEPTRFDFLSCQGD